MQFLVFSYVDVDMISTFRDYSTEQKMIIREDEISVLKNYKK